MASDRKEHYRYLALGSIHRKYRSADSAAHEEKLIEVQGVTHGSYGVLLFDPKWKAKRLKILERDSNRCVICKSHENPQVHHRQYHFIASSKSFSLPWEYDDHLLITLCQKCHQKGHRQYKVPTKYI